VKPPRLNGIALANLARLSRTRIGGKALQRMLRKELGVDRLAALPDTFRNDLPLDTRPHPGRPPREMPSQDLPWPDAGWAPSSTRIAEAYRSGKVSPREVTARALAEARRLAALTPTVGPMCELAEESAMAEAAEAETRWREGRSRGPFDGVPWVVKEQLAVRGLAQRAGTAYIDPAPRNADATCVRRVRDTGAVTLGTTTMTELGMTPNGANPKRTMPRNPHRTDRLAGGSSTGSGVAVATGLVPFALGADGGGSIRIPAAMNGVFGIKPTWARVSRAGELGGGSVTHVGPLAGGSVDLARALEAMSGHDGDDPQTLAAPARAAGTFVSALGRGVRGLRIGVPDREWADATGDIQRAGREAIAALEKEGATLVPLDLPLATHASAIGVVIIACEARALMRAAWRLHADEMGEDLQVSFAVLDAFSAIEYLETCRLRSGLRREMARAFGDVDLVAMPSTTSAAAKVTDTDMRTGFLDTEVIDGLCRFAFLGNLTGLPAASLPVGVDGDGLPLGLQLMGDAWDEATILAASAHLERIGVARTPKPGVAVSVLD